MAPIPLLSTLSTGAVQTAHFLATRQFNNPNNENGDPANGHPEFSKDPMVNPAIPLPMICLVVSVFLVAGVAAIINGGGSLDAERK
jgi:hypothetical protein